MSVLMCTTDKKVGAYAQPALEEPRVFLAVHAASVESQFGAGSLRAMLESFADGLGTSEVVQAALGISAEKFDRAFEAHVEAEFGPTMEILDEWHETQTRMMAAADSAVKPSRSLEVFG